MESLYSYQNQLIESSDFLFCRGILGEIEWKERLIGLTGARGVGKTTLMLQHLLDSSLPTKRKLYLSMDNLNLPFTSLISFAEKFYQQGGKLLMVDEIHKLPDWSAELKNIYDLLPGLQVVFSGSSLLKIKTGSADLSRRAVIYNIQGLSFREYLQINLGIPLEKYPLKTLLKDHEAISHEINKKLKPLQYFNDYLKHGYYPFYLQSVNTYPLKLNAVLNFIIETEIPSIINLDQKNIGKIKRLLQIIAASTPFQPNIVKLSESLDTHRSTLLQYLHLLETTDITRNLYSDGSFYGKLSKPGKILLHHPNLAYCLNEDVNSGSNRESFFCNQVSAENKVELSAKADFIINGKYSFEIGGAKKTRRQISGLDSAYIVADDLAYGYENKIPIWLFGFLY